MSAAATLSRPGYGAAAGRRDDIVIAAGGTGGHLTPAAALADELADRGRHVVLMSDARSAELAASLFAAHERFVLPGQGVAGRNVFRAAKGVASLSRAALQARALMARDAPAAVVGFGGYPSVGPVLATRLLRRRPRVILHEQNAVLGGANRTLARFADVIALSNANTARLPSGARTALTGNPVRPAIIARAGVKYEMPGETVHVLVLGGSQGARVLSDVIPAALARLPEGHRARLRVMQQCRPEDLARVRAVYDAAGISAELAPFFSDVADLLAASHLVVARSGASTVAELGVIGRPAILVPLPGAVDGDQRMNAEAFVAGGAGWMFPQSAFSAAMLTTHMTELLDDPARLAAAAARASRLGHADAASALADLVEQTIADGPSA
jgi:UDP-N-acetylglucosamine--N-acetylmuramyl-(pentapeptide) pyrophosphoryl-undecaprenol N-acetylglucosamine transferase